MVYVFDTSSLSIIFLSYYTSIFPSFWNQFNELATSQKIVSTREVKNELLQKNLSSLQSWINNHTNFFLDPANIELEFITKIYSIKHFQFNLKEKDRLQAKPHADPFVIAKAKIINGSVVTQELFKENAAKIPNICKHFEVKCIDLETFLIDNNCRW